jgi:hypothetical protein
VIVDRRRLPGDPEGYSVVDVGDSSEFATIEQLIPKIYGADYDTAEVRKHHSSGRHEYLVSNTILRADAVISVPKLKTHKKAGITVSLKNTIGIIGDKNFLPHHRIGPISRGGDEFEGERFSKMVASVVYNTVLRIMARWPSSARILQVPGLAYSLIKETSVGGYEAGNWHGNDTIWRTTIDLNKVLRYADSQGTVRRVPQRRYLSIVDAIVAGEREGPLDPSDKSTGLILGGSDPVVVDMTSARLMGFDYRMIPTITGALDQTQFALGGADPTEIVVHSNNPRWADVWQSRVLSLGFVPHSGWIDALEITKQDMGRHAEDGPSKR